MLLWDRTKTLPKDLLKQVEDVYRDSFPLEVRLHLAAWIEEHCSPNTPFNPQDANHQACTVEANIWRNNQVDAAFSLMFGFCRLMEAVSGDWRQRGQSNAGRARPEDHYDAQ